MNFITEVQARLRDVGYVADEGLSAQVALLLASNGGSVRAMLLDGPPGAGKTALAKAVARVMGVDYIYTQAHPGSSPEDFLYDANIVQILRGVAGDASAVRSAEDVVDLGFIPQVFLASQKGPVVAFVDELDKSSAKVDSLFLAALQEGEVNVKGYGRIRAEIGNLVLFFTKNDERAISEPLMRRCRREYLNFPSAELELALLTGKVRAGEPGSIVRLPHEPVDSLPEQIAQVLVTTAQLLRGRTEEVIKPPSTQELQMAGKDVVRLCRWGSLEHAGAVAFGWLAGFQEDRDVLERLCSKQKLQQLLAAAAQASRAEVAAGAVAVVNDDFVSFGR